MKILVLGGDGFCGWPTALHLSALGHDITIVDNLSRRRIDQELGYQSLTPVAPLPERLTAWKRVTGRAIGFANLDLAHNGEAFTALLGDIQPDAVVHFAEQRSAPYSMRNPQTQNYTLENNLLGTHAVLSSIARARPQAHLVHLGSIGVYGYMPRGTPLPNGYLSVVAPDTADRSQEIRIAYPHHPGTLYHVTKSLDATLFEYFNKLYKLKITDLYQGVVWGTQTPETRLADALINRFDYDGDYGTVLNRFLVQAVLQMPLTVHGAGRQTRAFIHLKDTVKCIEMALRTPPDPDDGVRIINQVSESKSILLLARMIAERTGAEVVHIANPREECEDHDFDVDNSTLRNLGWNPLTFEDSLFSEVTDIVSKYHNRIDRDCMAPSAVWKVA